ncbi:MULTISPECIES: ribosomal-processing cysteine protease Prp [Megasphaera]|uniref:Ribosomal processing cysteine protease Prp n=1 Tax=Megasphaera vaginalis (ex Srinivasan et al. 2021) TaxID=1111454 RepID=U7URR5_9FIRM|nr:MULTISPECIES: ribosomal-processing cysteine protease Prp [Megasphaera]ERT61986.1 PF04327 family protein [Megasphaera vaginalis (ex Srinivasan et al. 2021)]
MITVSLFRNGEHRFSGFEASGHADYGEAGADIVCAAVSALTQTALLGLLKYAGGRLSYSVKDGFVSVRLQAVTDETEVIMETLQLGLQEISRQYEKYVAVYSSEAGGERNVQF